MKLKYTAKTHAYYLDKKRCKSPSGVAKAVDDQSSLTNWKLRQCAIGIAHDPADFVARVSAASENDELNAICQEAIDRAGGSSGKNRGTAIHKITELLDSGDTVLDTPLVVETRKTWRTLLDDNDLEVVLAEGVIVHPDELVAGRFDRIVRHRASGTLYVLDIKTGASADKFLQAHSIQLGIYASAPFIGVGPQGDVDFEVDEFAPMPAVSQTVALVAHLPAEGEPSIVAVDIAAGIEMWHNTIKPVYEWRSRKDLRVDDWQPAAVTVDLELLKSRIATIRELGGINHLADSWPTNVPTFKTAHVHTVAELRLIEAAIEKAEAQVRAPFTPRAVVDVERAPAPVSEQIVSTTRLDEANLDHERAELLGKRLKELDPQHKALADTWAKQASEAGVPISISRVPSQRRCDIVEGVITWCQIPSDDVVRAVLEELLGHELQPSITTGAYLGSLTLDEAHKFANWR